MMGLGIASMSRCVQPDNHTSPETSNIIKHKILSIPLLYCNWFAFFWLTDRLRNAGLSGPSIEEVALLCCYAAISCYIMLYHAISISAMH